MCREQCGRGRPRGQGEDSVGGSTEHWKPHMKTRLVKHYQSKSTNVYLENSVASTVLLPPLYPSDNPHSGPRTGVWKTERNKTCIECMKNERNWEKKRKKIENIRKKKEVERKVESQCSFGTSKRRVWVGMNF